MGDFNTIGNVFANLSGFTIGYIIVQVVVFGILIHRYQKSKKTENQALKNIEAAIKNNPNEQWTNYTLNELFEQQNSKSKFVQQWKRYYERVSKNDEDEKIKVDRYLGVEALTYAIGERGILDVGGGVHTSIGVLGTFIGLIIGLSDLNTLDAEQLRSGIDTLMSGMTTAFVTSVVGVLLSLLWLLFDRWATMDLDAKIDWHAHTFAALLDVDDEQLFLNRLQKISQQQAEQMTTLLTDALERAFTPFAQTMQSGFGRMETQLQTQNDLVQQQMELSQHQSADLSDKLVDSLTTDTKSIMQDFMNVLHTSKSMQENMVQAVGDITTKFEVAATKQEEVFNRTEQMMQSYT
ncbi:MAG: MotA/TolQ/ExbB proton channel family protein, partial [Caryophanon sp.]|nr:MotA/TolQ/ExbB proton channel family protein [Caryophanon sp.]